MKYQITHTNHKTVVMAETPHRAARTYAAQGRCKPLEQFTVSSNQGRSVWKYDPTREHLVREVL